MSSSFTIETNFKLISLSKFEANLNHPKLNQMLEKKLGFTERKLVNQEDLADGIKTWSFHVTKSGDMPAALKKILVGNNFSWQEDSRFVPSEHCIYWEITPLSNLVKFSGTGTWELKKLGSGTKRIISGTINVAIPIVGKMVESLIIKELVSIYEVEPKIQEEFFDAHT